MTKPRGSPYIENVFENLVYVQTLPIVSYLNHINYVLYSDLEEVKTLRIVAIVLTILRINYILTLSMASLSNCVR